MRARKENGFHDRRDRFPKRQPGVKCTSQPAAVLRRPSSARGCLAKAIAHLKELAEQKTIAECQPRGRRAAPLCLRMCNRGSVSAGAHQGRPVERTRGAGCRTGLRPGWGGLGRRACSGAVPWRVGEFSGDRYGERESDEGVPLFPGFGFQITSCRRSCRNPLTDLAESGPRE